MWEYSIIGILVLLIFYLFYRLSRWKKACSVLVHKNTSAAVKHGKNMEQLLPFTASFPYDVRDFRFLGSPIDGVVFSDDAIVFVEFKTGKSRFSSRQKRIKELVTERKVKWLEMRG
jgi:predicted Holliday junction resolvase-like endonuclease